MNKLKLVADLHTHTVASDGYHTIFEVVQIARDKGLSIIGISDHAFYYNKNNSYFFVFAHRTPKKYNEVRIIKSIEANFLLDGSCDTPEEIADFLDLIMVGFHDYGLEICNLDERKYTEAILKCLRNCRVDVITHLCMKDYPLDLEKVVKIASEKGIAVEINNTNLRENKTDLIKLKRLLELVKKYNCPILANSDGHNWGEIGHFEKIEKFINENNFDPNIFINSSEEKVLKFIESRKSLIK